MGHTARIPGEPSVGPQPVAAPVSLPGELSELELLEGVLPRHDARAVRGRQGRSRAHLHGDPDVSEHGVLSAVRA